MMYFLSHGLDGHTSQQQLILESRKFDKEGFYQVDSLAVVINLNLKRI